VDGRLEVKNNIKVSFYAKLNDDTTLKLMGNI
jgi:hypothetical protein